MIFKIMYLRIFFYKLLRFIMVNIFIYGYSIFLKILILILLCIEKGMRKLLSSGKFNKI